MNFAEEKSDFREKWRFEKNLYYYKSSKDTEDSEWEWKLFQIFVRFIILFRFDDHQCLDCYTKTPKL